MKDLLIVAHRGDSRHAPENTLAAVRLAWEKSTDAVEVDVHMTADGRIAVIHDPTTLRTTGTDLTVADTVSAELRVLDAGSLKSPEFRGERIPFLEEVLETAPPGKTLIIEIKCGSGIYSSLAENIERSGKISQVVVIGFDIATVAGYKRIMPDITMLLLSAPKKEETSGELIPSAETLVQSVLDSGLDGLSILHTALDEAFTARVKASGLLLYAWTVNDPVEARRVAGLGVDGITTDDPQLIGKSLSQPL